MAKSKYTEEFVREFLKELGCELISPYTGVKDKFDYLCSCGEISTANFDGFINKNQKGCKNCRGKRVNENRKLTIEYVKEYFKEQGCTLLEDKYVNSKTKMKYICNCGGVDYKDWNHFNRGQRCKECATRQKSKEQLIPFNEIVVFFESHGFILLDKEYNGGDKELNYICICGRLQSKKYNTLKHSPKCNCDNNYVKFVKRKLTKDDLVEYFWKFYDEFGKYPTPKDLKEKEGYPSVSSYQRKWGSYSNFLKEISIMGDSGWLISDEKVLKEYYHLGDIETINSKLSKIRSESTIRHKANELGLKISHEVRYGNKKYNKEDIIYLLNEFVDKYNYTPTEQEFHNEYKKLPISISRSLFGSWNKSLEEAGIELKIKTTNFTDDDYSLMVDMYENGVSNLEIAEYFEIHPANLHYHLHKNEVELKNRRWSDDEIQYLKDNYANEPLKVIQKKLPDFSLENIFTKASKLGLKRKNSNLKIEKHIASDGTECLSFSEYKVHEILLYNEINTEKEKYYSDILNNDNLGMIRCDWFIEDGSIIIEYFGMNTPQYVKKAERKKFICEQYNQPLISLYYYDLLYDFKGLKKKFKKYGYEINIPDFLLEEQSNKLA